MAESRKRQTPTKKHLARMERERIQRRYLVIGALIVGLAVFVLVGFGILQQMVLQPRQPVATVGDETITSRDFSQRVRYQRRQLVQQYLNTYQTMQLFGGGDQNTQAFFVQNLRQIEFQLDPVTLGQQVLNTMVEDVLIRQEAAKRNISLSEEEVDKALQEAFGYYPEGEAPTPTPPPTTAPTSTLSPMQLALVPPTPTPTEVITSTAEVTSTNAAEATSEVAPTPSGPSTEATDARTTETDVPVAPETGTPVPTPTPFTLEAFQQNYADFLEVLEDEINFSEQQLREVIESQLYREKVFEAVTADLARAQEQVWARHILVEDQETAEEVLARLEAGDDFARLAAENSTDESNKEQGGDLGWFPLARMAPEFEKVAFSLGIGEISDPVQTQFGWHIIQVLGHEERPLSDSEYRQMRQEYFSDWLTQQRSASDVVTFEYWRDSVPSEPTIPPEVLQSVPS